MDNDLQLKKSILQTLCYADIFNYPLTAEEINKFLISQTPSHLAESKNTLLQMYKNKIIGKDHQLFFLKARKSLVQKRRLNQKNAREKIKIANHVANYLKLIPTIKAVAVTGALAMKNTADEDDIDLMIITSAKRLWTTRLLTIPLVSIKAKRRKPELKNTNHQQNWKNAICLNLFLDENNLSVPKKNRNLYTAHEVIQTKWIWSREDTSKKFLSENSWVKKYLPNVKLPKEPKKTIEQFNNLTILRILETLAFKAQLLYMKSKITREQIGPESAFFHPRNTAQLILIKYKSRINRYAKK